MLADSGRKYVALHLSPRGMRSRIALSRAVYGETYYADVRVAPDGNL